MRRRAPGRVPGRKWRGDERGYEMRLRYEPR